MDTRSGALAGERAGRNAGEDPRQPRSFAPKDRLRNQAISFADKSDGWNAETDFAGQVSSFRAIDHAATDVDRTEALALARLAAAELSILGRGLGLGSRSSL